MKTLDSYYSPIIRIYRSRLSFPIFLNRFALQAKDHLSIPHATCPLCMLLLQTIALVLQATYLLALVVPPTSTPSRVLATPSLTKER
jgi:hypothetical protein